LTKIAVRVILTGAATLFSDKPITPNCIQQKGTHHVETGYLVHWAVSDLSLEVLTQKVSV